ncbi:delta-lactam-biosynthetic de-N-acetylase [Peribacillus sp. NPDC096448]|uniref:delta-lactam-biosynthetic de-N-acetylase n=1 Tax=Peribacillus sp. NPDC096448 TaxID=3364395 RepID=UPI00270DCD0F|nr:delta-lactam-biosynthetic de-N-acetylase [Peribacillus frigoritolerans]
MKKMVILSAFICLMCSLASPAFAESYNWGFNKGKNGTPADAGKKFNEMLPEYEAIYKGDTKKKVVYLTFDNGYENGYTAQILDVLKKHGAPGTFFVTGHYLKTAPELVVRMANEGHIVGNHSWNHPDMTSVTDDVIRTELERVKEATEKLTGQKGMNYLRPPRGIFNERTMRIAKKEGYYHIFWSLAYRDWIVDQQKGAAFAHDEVLKQIHPGAILLLHTVSKDNAEALDSILTDLEKQGYTFGSLDELMIAKQLPNRMLY